MKVPFLRLPLAAAAILGGTLAGVAQDGVPVARYEAWDVHVLEGPQGRTCVVASQPAESRPTNVTRSAILFMITDWPAAGTQNEISVEMGYPLATDVTVRIDNEASFTMTIVEGEAAWLATEVEDNLLVAAMRRGRSMVVTARSTRGTDTTDTYSLYGVSAALARAAEECS